MADKQALADNSQAADKPARTQVLYSINTDQRSGKNARQKISTTGSARYHSLLPLTGHIAVLRRGIGANQSLPACFVGNFQDCLFVSTGNRVIRASSEYVTM